MSPRRAHFLPFLSLSRSKCNPRAGLAIPGIKPPFLYVKLALFEVADLGDLGVHGGVA